MKHCFTGLFYAQCKHRSISCKEAVFRDLPSTLSLFQLHLSVKPKYSQSSPSEFNQEEPNLDNRFFIVNDTQCVTEERIEYEDQVKVYYNQYGW